MDKCPFANYFGVHHSNRLFPMPKYTEMFWRAACLSGTNRSINFICVAQVCTLGRNIGAILFMDGRRVRNSPLNELYTSNPV